MAYLSKGIDWSQKAKVSGIEVSKDIGLFGDIGLYFVSTNRGAKSTIILRIGNNSYGPQVELSLDPEHVNQLLSLCKQIPSTLQDLNRNEAKAKILQ